MRAQVVRLMREHLDALGFVEIETPILTRSTPEGSRDFLVPSRMWPGSFYALPQSPQQLKQLLMIGGQDRYYQIVRCLRDEAAPRRPRIRVHPARRGDVVRHRGGPARRSSSRCTRASCGEVEGVDVQTPFPRLTYAEMMQRYGSDKPDLRYGMELVDLAPVFAETGFNAFAKVLAGGGVIKALVGAGGGLVLPQGARPADRRRQGPGSRGARLDGRRGRTPRCARPSRSSSHPRRSRACWS